MSQKSDITGNNILSRSITYHGAKCHSTPNNPQKMSKSPSPTPPKGSVRSIISIFENQSFAVADEPTNLIRRTKSMGSLNQQPRVIIRKTVDRAEPPSKSLELAQIEQQIRHLQNNLNNYRTYSRENHVYYQNQIVFVFTDLANLETGNSDAKSELTEALKRLNKKLNALLPDSKKVKHEKVRERVKVGVKKEVAPLRQQVSEEKEVVLLRHQVSEEKEVVLPRQQVSEEKEDEIDSPAISVRTLKQMFEKNTNESEAKREFGSAKVTRKFLTFNGTSDLKYVPYSQKYKSGLDAEFLNSEIEGRYEFTRHYNVSGSVDENYEDKEENLSPDSLSESSSEGSGDEQGDGDSVKEKIEA